MKKTLLAIGSALLLLSACNTANNENKDANERAKDANERKMQNTQIDYDAEYAVDAAEGGLMEVELGRLAATNASHPKVKEFGAMMVQDHSAANEELKAIAAQKNITLPAALGENKREKVAELSKLMGADFDKKYASFMVEDHEEDIKLFQKEAENGNDASLKQWAAAKVPTLQHHLEMAKAAKEAVK